MNNAELKKRLDAWYVADARMRQAVAAEIEARSELVAFAFPKIQPGTNNLTLPGDQYTLTVKLPEYYKLDKDKTRVNAVEAALPPAVRTGLFKWQADISVSAYKALEPSHKKIVNEILTISPGRPSAEVVPIKKR